MKPHTDLDQANSLAVILAELPIEFYERLDRREPEWDVFETLAPLVPKEELLVLAVSTGLIDYQLGVGAAAALWQAVKEVFTSTGLSGDADLLSGMMELLQCPVNRRFGKRKRERIQRFISSGYPAWLRASTGGQLRDKPLSAWDRLSKAMRQKKTAKTIVFSMKALDLAHKVAFGSYLPFPPDMPMIIDVRVAKVSLASGIVRGNGAKYNTLRSRADNWASEFRSIFLDAWKPVAGHLASADSPISMFRLDSLIWQVAELIESTYFNSERCRKKVAQWLIEGGLETGLANSLAGKLTVEL